MIMKQAKYNPRKSFRIPQPQDVPLRRRNLSLGSNPESKYHESSISRKYINHIAEPVYTSRKNRNIIKPSKLKIAKFMSENTRLCQENILQYHNLKQKVKQNSKMMIDETDQLPTKLEYSPKLSIKNLGMAVYHQFVTKNRSYLQRKHLKTYMSNEQPLKKPIRDELIPIKVPISIKNNSQRYSIQLTAKKYNQMTLREIAQVDQGPKFNILLRLRQLKNKQTSKRISRRPSDDYSLQGW